MTRNHYWMTQSAGSAWLALAYVLAHARHRPSEVVVLKHSRLLYVQGADAQFLVDMTDSCVW